MKNRISEYMKKENITIDQLANVTGIDRNLLENIVYNKKQGIDYNYLIRLGSYFEISPGELLILDEHEDWSYCNDITDKEVKLRGDYLIKKINEHDKDFFRNLNEREKKDKLRVALLNSSAYQCNLRIKISQLLANSNM